jgi:hypothetical protein
MSGSRRLRRGAAELLRRLHRIGLRLNDHDDPHHAFEHQHDHRDGFQLDDDHEQSNHDHVAHPDYHDPGPDDLYDGDDHYPPRHDEHDSPGINGASERVPSPSSMRLRRLGMLLRSGRRALPAHHGTLV